MKKKRRLRNLEHRVTALETTRPDLPPVNQLDGRPLNPDRIWRRATTDYASYIDDETEGWQRQGYL